MSKFVLFRFKSSEYHLINTHIEPAYQMHGMVRICLDRQKKTFRLQAYDPVENRLTTDFGLIEQHTTQLQYSVIRDLEIEAQQVAVRML